jgi:threonine aldolase
VRSFASDNYAGAHPAVLEALVAANADHARAYGADPWTARAEELLRAEFGEHARSFLVFNGTGANVLALQAAFRRPGASAVICAATAHVNVDEGGAPERIAGAKLLSVATADGKLRPADVERWLARVGDEHAAQPALVTISQSTELGTRYAPQEIAALADVAHANGLLLHLDGSRLCHAAAALDQPLRALTTDVGVDLVSFGATKVGAVAAEALVVLVPELAEGILFLRKQSLQLASKGRFLAAQVEALLRDELWRELAGHANAMARRLARALGDVPGVTITQAVEANAVFAILPSAATTALQERWPFYVWDPATGEVRWMCSWDTTADEVDAFATAVRDALALA